MYPSDTQSSMPMRLLVSLNIGSTELSKNPADFDESDLFTRWHQDINISLLH